jgi:uncharacterized membrane protein
MSSGIEEKREMIFLAIIIFASAVLRFYRIGGQSYWIDELLSLGASTAPEGISFWEKILHDVHGPLHSVIIHFLQRFSTTEYLLRSPSAIAGILSVFFIYRWLKMIGRGDVAIYAALILALSPYNLYYSQELRFYSLLTLFVILSMMAFQRYLRDPTISTGLVLGIALTCASLSHFSALFLPVGFTAYLLVSRKLGGRYIRAGLVAAAVLLLAISPWVYREIENLRGIEVVHISKLPVEDRLRGDLTLNPWSYPYTFYAFSVGYSFGPDLRVLHGVDSAIELLAVYWPHLLIVMIVFGYLMLHGVIEAARRGNLAQFLSIGITGLAMITVIALLNIKVFNVRYLTVLFPIFVALIACGLPRGRMSRYAALVIVCVLFMASNVNYYADPTYARDDIRSAVDMIEQEEGASDLILGINSVSVIEHYYDGTNRVQWISPIELGREETYSKVDRYLAREGRVWYLRLRHWDSDPSDMLLEALQGRGMLLGEWEYPGIRLLLFDGASGEDNS